MEEEEIDIRKLADLLEPGDAEILKDIRDNVRLAHKEERIFQDCVRAIKERELEHKEKELITRLSMADEEENEEVIRELTQELMNIQKMRKTVGGR